MSFCHPKHVFRTTKRRKKDNRGGISERNHGDWVFAADVADRKTTVFVCQNFLPTVPFFRDAEEGAGMVVLGDSCNGNAKAGMNHRMVTHAGLFCWTGMESPMLTHRERWLYEEAHRERWLYEEGSCERGAAG